MHACIGPLRRPTYGSFGINGMHANDLRANSLRASDYSALVFCALANLTTF